MEVGISWRLNLPVHNPKFDSKNVAGNGRIALYCQEKVSVEPNKNESECNRFF